MVVKKFTIFEVFQEYLGEFIIFLHKIFFGGKILSSSFSRHQNFDYECCSYSGNES